ncbi:hypothetical protein TRFO_23749 [Tritrichomonas foetus]|uniref:Uncharacterized protein n=1 Tax=Tritrichomonas foetus TaxID=1144522 RepID=A0A1J4KDT7_9EUKA|nr:hypothetical protein TRFO_23749 [Tritrichomonas foetus]|eukprot:OHT07884.1 hypothetical protein TRFO_23749 [Tritrichomonas foetus]
MIIEYYSKIYIVLKNNVFGMILLLFLLKYKDICVSGTSITRDSQCMSCSPDGCITLTELSSIDINSVNKIIIINDTTVNFQSNKVEFSYKENVGYVSNYSKKLTISSFTNKANITIKQSSTKNNQLTSFESYHDVFYRFVDQIVLLPADFTPSKNVRIYSSSNVSINGVFSLNADCFINFTSSSEIIHKISFQITTVSFGLSSKIVLSSTNIQSGY